MTQNINRRSWLRSTALLTTGLVAAPALTSLEAATSKSKFQNVGAWEIDLPYNPMANELKARLLANENPFGPSESAKKAIMESITNGNRYGHGQAAELRKLIAKKEGVSEEHILLAPGSTDILEKTAIALFYKGGNVVSADPAYMSLIKTAQRFDADWRKVPLTNEWAHDLEGMASAVNRKTKMVYICNPNNPTGSITDNQKLRDFCSTVSDKVPVFVDEAYLEFLDKSEEKTMVNLIKKGKNVIVARTFSKIHAMAGLRIGYMVALPETIEMITSMVRSNMGLCVTSMMGAMASLQDTEFQMNSKKWTAEGREQVYTALESMGFDYVPSYTSFILFPIAMQGQPFLKKMFAHGIGVRAFEVFGKPYCRVSMGTQEELSMFSDALKKV
ncbi:MAG: histidinol-phosphate transaminase, partial [Bacteroidota bacterium]